MVVVRGCRLKKLLSKGKLNTLNTSLSIRLQNISWHCRAHYFRPWLALRFRTPGGCVRSCKSPEKQRWPKGWNGQRESG